MKQKTQEQWTEVFEVWKLDRGSCEETHQAEFASK
jgi:hypothetical protein